MFENVRKKYATLLIIIKLTTIDAQETHEWHK